MPRTTSPTEAEISRQRLAEARERHDQNRATLAELRSEIADLDRRVRSGDASSAERLVFAEAQAVHVERAVAATKTEVGKSEQGVIPDADDLAVAEALAVVLQDALRVSVTVTNEADPTVPSNLPALVVVQRKLANGLPNGRIQCDALTVLYFRRGGIHRELDRRAMEDLLSDSPMVTLRHQPGYTGRVLDDGTHVDQVGLTGITAWPADGLPVVTGEASPGDIRSAAEGVAHRAGKAAGRRYVQSSPNMRGAGLGDVRGGVVRFAGNGHTEWCSTGTAEKVRMVSSTSDGETRIVVVGFDAISRDRSEVRTPSQHVETIVKSLDAEIGQCAASLGRCVGVKVNGSGIGVESPHGKAAGGRVSAELTYQARIAE